LKARAIDNGGAWSDVETRTYTFSTVTQTVTVFFKKPSIWAAPKIHYWNRMPGATSSTWPGVNMTSDGGDWFKFTFDATTGTNLLFHDGTATNKTVDLFRDADGWYENGAWKSTDPRIVPPGPGLTVHFKRPSTWGTTVTPTIYFWSAAPGGANELTWPGVNMTAETNGWFKYTIPNASCSNIIFSNNGASKTADLSRCEEGWYSGTTWYSSNPDNATGFTVYFKPTAYTAVPNIYFWNVQPTQATTTWPGPKMTADVNGWYKYTFTGATSANVIFSNNGASQTADLTRSTNGWYINGTWYNSNPGLRTAAELDEANGLGVYPNPFEGSTTMSFTLEEAGHVALKVYNLAGSEVATLVNERLSEGEYRQEWAPKNVQAGVYIARLTFENGQTIVKKIVLQR
jgi:hypothetical protein